MKKQRRSDRDGGEHKQNGEKHATSRTAKTAGCDPWPRHHNSGPTIGRKEKTRATEQPSEEQQEDDERYHPGQNEAQDIFKKKQNAHQPRPEGQKA